MPGAAPTRRPSCCCRRSRTATSGPTSPRSAFPREEQVRADARGPRRGGPAAEHGRPRDRTSSSAATGSRRCSRCSTSTAPYAGCRGGWVATGQPWAYDEERYRRVDRGARARAAGDARLPRDRPVPDALPARAARRPGRRRLRPVRQLRRARARRPTVSAAAVEEAEARLSRPGVVVEPRKMWPTALANLGVDLQRQDRPRRAEEGRAVARLTDLGYGQRAARAVPRRPPRTARCRCRWSGRWSRCSATGVRRWTAIVVVESATRPTLTADLADGLSRFLQGPGRRPLRDRRPRRRARARVRPTRRSGSPPSAAGSTSQAEVAGGQPDPARRRPGRHRLDAHPGRRGAIRAAGAAEVRPLVLATTS